MLPAAVAALSVAGAALLGAAPAWVAWTGAALLLILPFFGLLFVLGPRRWAAVLAAWGWSALLLAATPYWVPGARGPALAAGLRAVSAPLGAGVVPDADALAAWIGRLVDRLLPPPGGGTAPTEAATGSSHRPAAGPRPRVDRELPAEPAVAPASLSSAAASGSIVLSAEEEGRTLRVPVTFAGPRGPLELSMMFDTGATVTTLDSKTLARLGVPVATDAPQVTLQTAGGEKKARLVLVDSVQLGDARIRHVSVAVCESCAQGKASGLLGLNVTGLFDVTLRQEEREFVLSPRDGGIDRQLDVSHWLDISSTARQWPGGRVEVEVAAANRAVVPVAEAVIEVECREASFAVQLDDVPARGRQQSKVQLPDGTDCGSYRIVLRSARW
jgi:clan AA aspartic protease (TIGR02281 family)